jgi:hypothetical protein
MRTREFSFLEIRDAAQKTPGNVSGFFGWGSNFPQVCPCRAFTDTKHHGRLSSAHTTIDARAQFPSASQAHLKLNSSLANTQFW